MRKKTTTIFLNSLICLVAGCGISNLGQITNQTLKRDNLKILSKSRTFAVTPVVSIPATGLLGATNQEQQLISDIKVAQSIEHELKKRGYVQTIEPLAQIVITYAREQSNSINFNSNNKNVSFFNLTARNRSSGQILYFVRMRLPDKSGKDEDFFQEIAGTLVWQALEQFPRRKYNRIEISQKARL
jgi:hypothetical protein